MTAAAAAAKSLQLGLSLCDPIAHQAPLSMGFSRQEYWSGLPFPSPGDLPDPGIETRSPLLKPDSLPSEPPGKPHMSDKQTKKNGTNQSATCGQQRMKEPVKPTI